MRSRGKRGENEFGATRYGQDGALPNLACNNEVVHPWKLESWRWVQIQSAGGEVIITNDGATILNKLEVQHPAAKMVRRRVCRVHPPRFVALGLFCREAEFGCGTAPSQTPCDFGVDLCSARRAV
jgi:hypothetical protein